MRFIGGGVFVCAILAATSMSAGTNAMMTMTLSVSGFLGDDCCISSMQGSVLTSSGRWNGRSFGWVNRNLIASQKAQEHINGFGGEGCAHSYQRRDMERSEADAFKWCEGGGLLSPSIPFTNVGGERVQPHP